ncbi:hypothetical protein ES703_63040 [subsurface metagenome]
MPQFAPSEVKTARAPVTVEPSGLSCQIELALMSNGVKAATSVVPFTSTGAQQPVSLPITMPSAEGTYPVYLDILAEDLLIGAFVATEDVVIAAWAPPLAPCVYCGAQFTTESDLVAHMEANHPGKPYIVWASLPEKNVLLTPGGQYSIEAKVFVPSVAENEQYRFAFWSYQWECIAAIIVIDGGTPAGFHIGEAASYHCLHRLGRWYCPPLGENIVRSDCYFTYPGMPGRWYDNPIWKGKDIGLRVNFIA